MRDARRDEVLLHRDKALHGDPKEHRGTARGSPSNPVEIVDAKRFHNALFEIIHGCAGDDHRIAVFLLVGGEARSFLSNSYVVITCNE